MGAFMISFSPVFVSLVNVSPTTSGFYRVFFGGVALTTFIFLSGRRLLFNKSIWIALVFSAVFLLLICGSGIAVFCMWAQVYLPYWQIFKYFLCC